MAAHHCKLDFHHQIELQLTDVHPNLGIDSEASGCLNVMIKGLFHRLISEVLDQNTDVTTDAIANCMESLVPGIAGRHAEIEGCNAVLKYMDGLTSFEVPATEDDLVPTEADARSVHPKIRRKKTPTKSSKKPSRKRQIKVSKMSDKRKRPRSSTLKSKKKRKRSLPTATTAPKRKGTRKIQPKSSSKKATVRAKTGPKKASKRKQQIVPKSPTRKKRRSQKDSLKKTVTSKSKLITEKTVTKKVTRKKGNNAEFTETSKTTTLKRKASAAGTRKANSAGTKKSSSAGTRKVRPAKVRKVVPNRTSKVRLAKTKKVSATKSNEVPAAKVRKVRTAKTSKSRPARTKVPAKSSAIRPVRTRKLPLTRSSKAPLKKVSPKQMKRTKRTSPKQTKRTKKASPKQMAQTKKASPKQTAQTKKTSPKQIARTEKASPKQMARTKKASPKQMARTKRQISPKVTMAREESSALTETKPFIDGIQRLSNLVHPNLDYSDEAFALINDMVQDFYDKIVGGIASECAINAEAVSGTVTSILPSSLATFANAEGVKSVFQHSEGLIQFPNTIEVENTETISFKPTINTLKNITLPTANLSKETVSYLNDFLVLVCESLLSKSKEIANSNSIETLTCTELQESVKQILPQELSRYAMTEGTRNMFNNF